ncbi:metallophosphoesterase family protein [Brevibacillus ginsengisoli]|uniref:metallophosphoesterase family protein n=1 Tax=Brevibacillus ginsengisoli TaxID=363854 RepID=UPI003CEE41B8
MSILILSDTHGLRHEVNKVVERHQLEQIFHCGDFCVDRTKEPFQRMKMVRGNCDMDRMVPEEAQWTWRNLRIYQTHGHLYNVKSSLLKLHYRAEETNANLVIFGHSHVPTCAVERGILFLNPGSLQLPRGFRVPTYVILDQLASTPEQVTVEVSYYDDQGNPVTELGGEFHIRA